MANESRKVVYAALLANIAIAAAKFLAATFTRSSAMLTEGIHSLVDSGDGGLLLLGDSLGRKPPDALHPYGHGREVYFWSFVVSIMIFAVGGGISIYEGALRVRNPEPITNPVWTFAVLGVSFIFEGASFVVAVRHLLSRKRKNISLVTTIRRSKNPSDFMIAFEDSAALIGVIFAALGVALELWTGNAVYDGAASIAIGLLLAVVATLLAIETRSLLVGEAILPESAETIRRLVEEDPSVVRAADPLSVYLGPDNALINLALKFRPDLTTADIESAIDRIREKVQQRFPVIKRVYIAPESLEEAARHDRGPRI